MSTPTGARRAQVAPRRRGPDRLVAGVVALALVVAVALGYLLLRDDDTTGSTGDPADATGAASGAPGATSSPAEAEPDPLDDPLSPQSIDVRYESLGASVTAGSRACRDARARRGQAERLVCEAAVGTLELVTYRTAADLTARRVRAVTDQPGSVLEAGRRGVLMGFEAAAPKKPAAGGGKPAPTKAQTFLYTDDERALQSAYLATEAGTELDVLVAAYAATGPTRPYPAGPTNKKIVDFARRWARTDECLRIPTVNPGALEENYCDVKGPVQMFVGRFGTLEQLETYRRVIVASAVADDRDVRDWARGALYEYTTDDGTVLRYWDDTSCLCYGEAFLTEGSYERLATWWEQD